MKKHTKGVGLAFVGLGLLALVSASWAAPQLPVPSPGRITLYEHRNFGGQSRTFDLRCHGPHSLVDLRPLGFSDKVSSVAWDLAPGVEVRLADHDNGTGRQYVMRGRDRDADTHDNGFGDCCTSWFWHFAP